MENSALLAKFIDEDFGFRITGSGRWGKAVTHDSLVVDMQKGLFFWNSTEIVGGPLEYLTRVRKQGYNDALNTIKHLSKLPITLYTVRKEDNEEVVVNPDLVDIFWANGKNNREYWYNRLLTNDTIDRFKLGYYEGWYTVPIFDGGQFINFQMRREEPEKLIRAWYHGVGHRLFNSSILNVVKTVVITEGLIDSILLSQYGFPAMSTTGGSVWHKEWFYAFINQKTIYYVEDNDDAGRIASKKVACNLGQDRVRIVRFNDFPDKYDTVQFFRDGNDIDKFKDLMYNKYKYTFELERSNLK